MRHASPDHRRSLVAGALLASVLAVPAAASAQEPSASPQPITSPSPNMSPSPNVSVDPSFVPPGSDIVFYPLPVAATFVGPETPTVSVEPASSESLAIGEPLELELGHCGLYSPIDLDGSLWQADGGVTPSGGPIAEDDDAVIGELINATPGVFVLVGEDAAHFTTATGTILSFARAPGALEYPLCM